MPWPIQQPEHNSSTPDRNGCMARFHRFSSTLDTVRTTVKEGSLGSGMNTVCSVPVYRSEVREYTTRLSGCSMLKEQHVMFYKNKKELTRMRPMDTSTNQEVKFHFA
eukprot:1155652-Pelagomonas_calceolata.AAC.2